MQGLLDHLIELVVSEDHAFKILDRPTFRRLLLYIRPSLQDRDIPHRTKLRQLILERAKDAEDKVKAVLGVRFIFC